MSFGFSHFFHFTANDGFFKLRIRIKNLCKISHCCHGVDCFFVYITCLNKKMMLIDTRQTLITHYVAE